MAVYKVVSFMIVIVMVVLKAHGLSDIEAIEAQARRYEVAYGTGDIETVQSLYTEDCRVFPTGALPYTGRENLGIALREGRANGFLGFNLTTTEIFPMGQYYYRSGINVVTGVNDTVLAVLNFVTIFRKDCGEWLYLVDMVNFRM